MRFQVGLATAVEEEIGGTYPCQPSAAETCPVYVSWDKTGSIEHQKYTRLLNWCLKDEEEPIAGLTDLLVKPLVPLLYLDIFRIRKLCKVLRLKYQQVQRSTKFEWDPAGWEKELEKIYSDTRKDRVRLRAMVDDSEDGLNHSLRYIHSQTSADWPLNQSWLKVQGNLRTTHEAAHRFEAQLRDYLQLHVGELALRESKKSIELSDRQIEEGKRDQSYSYLQILDTLN